MPQHGGSRSSTKDLSASLAARLEAPETQSTTYLHDPQGRNITSAHRYIQDPARGRRRRAPPLRDNTDLRETTLRRRLAGLGLGSVFYIDQPDWGDRKQVELRVDANIVAYPSAPLLGSYITYVKQGERIEKVYGEAKAAGNGVVFGIRGYRNTVFLGRSVGCGLRVNYASSAVVETDTAGGFLEVEFVRMLGVDAAS
ncbi:hypothetical protein BJY00DRAFT_319284 [Aspergillus carlsbadensis]|nr:hypothetical protein BJY00DRAFT_319284 [Aspergillus carlsbadensis]